LILFNSMSDRSDTARAENTTVASDSAPVEVQPVANSTEVTTAWDLTPATVKLMPAELNAGLRAHKATGAAPDASLPPTHLVFATDRMDLGSPASVAVVVQSMLYALAWLRHTDAPYGVYAPDEQAWADLNAIAAAAEAAKGAGRTLYSEAAEAAITHVLLDEVALIVERAVGDDDMAAADEEDAPSRQPTAVLQRRYRRAVQLAATFSPTGSLVSVVSLAGTSIGRHGIFWVGA
jgi:hypothetical protein